MVEVAHWIGVYVAVQGGVHELSRVRDRSPVLLFLFFFLSAGKLKCYFLLS